MSITPLQVGDDNTVSVTVPNSAGTPTDPTTLILKVRKPGATVTTYTYPTDPIIVRDSVGNYHASLSCDTEGTWEYDWDAATPDYSTGGTFYVNPQYTSYPIPGQE